MSILDHCPGPPDWRVNWQALRHGYEWVEALHHCPQDPTYHAEGDVGVHTEMALCVLASNPLFRKLEPREQQIVFAAVLLHDIAKPACTKHEGDRITSRGHSRRGDIMAREVLWREDVAQDTRESICGLIRYHQIPFFLVERDDSQRVAFEVSQVARCDLLALVAHADGAGRRCAESSDQNRILDNVALFAEYCEEHGCLRGPKEFSSAHARFLYFRKPDRDPSYQAHDDTRCEVIVMSGLPGAGKDHWLKHHGPPWPVVSLDKLRAELGINPRGPQGRVVNAARARARERLRASEPFVWNATNVSRHLREQLVSLLFAYNARIRIVYVEASPDVVAARNAARPAPVPHAAIVKLLKRWTVPTLLEAHEVDWVSTT